MSSWVVPYSEEGVAGEVIGGEVASGCQHLSYRAYAAWETPRVGDPQSFWRAMLHAPGARYSLTLRPETRHFGRRSIDATPERRLLYRLQY